MAEGGGSGWRWSNVPVPEPHVYGFLLGLLLHRFEPRRAYGNSRYATVGGPGLVGSGLLIAGWSDRTTSGVDVEKPVELVTSGPYARSRDPMYVAWTGMYAGTALLVSSIWLFKLLPAVIAITRAIVRREECSLERRFGDEYRTYRRSVRRYV